MEEEVIGSLAAQLSGIERVVTLLLSEHLKRLSESDAIVLLAALNPTNVTPPQTDDLDLADHLAGRTIMYRHVVQRIANAAQEIANLKAD
jgi:hypothetical protein